MNFQSADTAFRMVQGAELASHDRLVYSLAGGTVVSQIGRVQLACYIYARLKPASNESIQTLHDNEEVWPHKVVSQIAIDSAASIVYLYTLSMSNQCPV